MQASFFSSRLLLVTLALAPLSALSAAVPFGAGDAYGQSTSGKAAGKKAGRTSTKAPPPKRRRPPGVRGLFEAAQELYDAGKYPAALAAYDALLRRYPGHEPAVIQTAKTLYRLDRIKDAYTVFTRINPQQLDPETSYEFGWSFYTNKSWEGAFFAFQRVPKGHALYDLANYYGAICAIKLKKYEDAEDMLDKAVVLPDKLAKSRSLYIKHVQALRLMQQKNALAKEREQEKTALTDASKKKPKVEGEETAPKSGEYVHKGFKYVDRWAKVGYAAVHQYIDHHGLKESNFDSRVSTFELKSGLIWPLPSKAPKERRAAFGVQLLLAAEDRITDGEEQRIIVNEDDQDLQRLLAQDLGETDVKSGIAGVEPWFEMPLPEELWLAFGGELNYTFPDFERGNRIGYRKGYGELNGKSSGLTFGGKATYTEVLDTKTRPISNVVGGSVYGEHDLVPQLTSILTLSHSVYDYLIEELELSGPDSTSRVQLELNHQLPLGFEFDLLGAYESQTNYIFHGIPTYGQVAADGLVTTGKISLIAKPLPFLEASLSQLIAKTTWSLDNEEAREPFELNSADYFEQFEAKVALDMTF